MLELQTSCNDEICQIELVLELIQKFELDLNHCNEQLKECEREVSELKNSMLDGNVTDELWNSAKKVRCFY